MNKLFITSVLLCSANLASASLVKLECPVTVEAEYSTGTVEKNAEIMVLEIETINGITFFSGSGRSLIDMSSKKSKSIVQVIDSSDSGKWELMVDTLQSHMSLRIDRNSGALFYQETFNSPRGGQIVTTVTGNCRKIDTSKRMF